MKEDEKLLEYFVSKIPNCDAIEGIQAYIQGMHYEQQMRSKEKGKIIKKLDASIEKRLENVKSVENLIRKLQNEIQMFKKFTEIRSLRHSGRYKDEEVEKKRTDSDIYDWIVDIDFLTNVSHKGWTVNFSNHFFKNSTENTKRSVIGSHYVNTSITKSIEKEDDTNLQNKWEGAIVAVVGLYDKGKTFVLNNLSFSNLPSGKKVNTKGLSFKYVEVDEGTKLILLDTAGSYSPVKVENNMSIIEREATEHFILELVFDVADYFLFVVNDFTSLDQRYLDKLSRSLQTSATKSFREVIVIHNFKEVESESILEHIWETQVRSIYSDGSTQKTLVAAKNPLNGKLEAKQVTWFKSPFTRHVCLVNHDSYIGINKNPWTFSLLRYWLKSVLVPLNREFSVVDNVINFSNQKLSQYFKCKIDLEMIDTEDDLKKKILCKESYKKPLRLPQISIDSSGFVMTRPDAFLPSVKNNNNSYF